MILECSCKWICEHSLINVLHLRCWVYDFLLLYKSRRIVCFSLFCSYKNVFYKVNTSLACLMDISRWQAGACSCMHWIMFVTCILMFFCSYVFLLLHPAFVKFRSLVLARDDVVGACGVLWMLTVFWQKNIRTKVCIEEFNIHSNGFDVYSNSSMPAPVALSFQLFLLNMNRRLFLLFL